MGHSRRQICPPPIDSTLFFSCFPDPFHSDWSPPHHLSDTIIVYLLFLFPIIISACIPWFVLVWPAAVLCAHCVHNHCWNRYHRPRFVHPTPNATQCT